MAEQGKTLYEVFRDASKCAECQKEIHPERIAAIPQTVTCSAKCSKARQLKHMAAGSKKSHAKKRQRGN